MMQNMTPTATMMHNNIPVGALSHVESFKNPTHTVKNQVVGGLVNTIRLFPHGTGHIATAESTHGVYGGLVTEYIAPDGTAGIQHVYPLAGFLDQDGKLMLTETGAIMTKLPPGVVAPPFKGGVVVIESTSGAPDMSHIPSAMPTGALPSFLETHGFGKVNWREKLQGYHSQAGTRLPTAATGTIPVAMATGQLPNYPTVRDLTGKMADMHMDETPTGAVSDVSQSIFTDIQPVDKPDVYMAGDDVYTVSDGTRGFIDSVPMRTAGFDELREGARLPTAGLPLMQAATGGMVEAPTFSMV